MRLPYACVRSLLIVAAAAACQGPGSGDPATSDDEKTAPGAVDTVEQAAKGPNEWFDLRLQIIALSDNAQGANGTTTTRAQITDFTNLANSTFARAKVRFRFDPDRDWADMVDQDLNQNLQWNQRGNWGRANQIAARFPGRVVIFLRFRALSNFAAVAPTNQPIPRDSPTPSPFPAFIAFMNQSGGAANNRENFSHELGHFLGLYHTHLTWGDPPSSSDAAIAALQLVRGAGALDGDLIADTPEDPGPVYWKTKFDPCASGAQTVEVGDVTYNPIRTNVMSYYGCGTTLTAGQAAAIRASLNHPGRAALSSPPCNADFHAYPIERFQTCFDHWTEQGLWPRTLTVSPDGRNISGSFQRGLDRGEVRTLMSIQEFDRKNREHDAASSIFKSVSSTNDGRLTAIWEPAGGDVISFRSLSEASFNEQFARQFENQYVLRDWFIHQVGGELRMHAAWARAGFAGNAAYYGLSWTDFVSRDSEMARLGLKVTHFLAYERNGQTEHAAVWAPAPGTRAVSVSNSNAEYQAEYTRQSRRGMRLQHLHTFGNARYAALWASD